MRHAYRLPWVIVMLDALSQGTTVVARMLFRTGHLARQVAKKLTRPPDESMPSLITQRLRRGRD